MSDDLAVCGFVHMCKYCTVCGFFEPNGLHQDCLDKVFRCTVLVKLYALRKSCMLLFLSRHWQTW